MAAPRLICYESAVALRTSAEQWDDLWQRSEGVLPTGSAALILDWLDQFAPRAKFIALAVEHDGRLVAALPFVERRLAGIVSVGSLPCNHWCWAGDLLLDLTCDVSAVLAVLMGELRLLPWPLVWIDAMPLAEPRWQHFLSALSAAGLAHTPQERFHIGRVGIVDQLHRNWEAYEQAWSGNHRRHMRKALRRAEEAGGLELDLRRPHSAKEMEELLREGFEVEHRSWKGDEGTSVLANSRLWNVYLRQAKHLAEWGYLELAFLRHRGKAIAFEYGWSVRGVYYTPKAGFDHDFSSITPGQLLRYLLLKDAFHRPDRQAVDFLGPLCEATARWSTQTYPVSRLIVETGKLRGRSLLWAHRHLLKPVRKLRNHLRPPQELKIVEVDSTLAALLPAAAGDA